MKRIASLAAVRVIAPNFKRRLSGVTSTIIQLVPLQNRLGLDVAVLGPGLPDHLPHIRFRELWRLWFAPSGAPHRIWHARRNNEMLAGLILRDLLRMRLRVIFTSASQRKHTGWTRFLVSRVDDVISTSAKTAAYLARSSHVVMHGIDLQRFRPPGDRAEAKIACGLDPAQKHVGCFGRVRHQKGTDLFVDAMIALLPTRPGWSAVIAGRATAQHKEFEAGLMERVRAAGLAERILFVGEHKNIDDWYRALDLFIAPQRWEGFGLTPLEAMASAVPVVATDVGAFSELVVTGEGGTGEIVETSAAAIAKAAARYMDDKDLLALASKRSRAHVEANFSLEREAQAIGAIYRKHLGLG